MKVRNQMHDYWDHRGVAFYDGSNTEQLAYQVTQYFQTISEISEDVADMHKITSAVGPSLERHGLPVGVHRRMNESDDRLRKRIILNYKLHFSEGTFEDVAEFMQVLYETKNISLYEQYEHWPATIFIKIPQSVQGTISFSLQEVKDFVQAIVATPHQPRLHVNGTFECISKQTYNAEGHDPNEGFSDKGSGVDGGTLATLI